MAERSARGREQCCINHCCYWIDSIKPSLVYSKYTIRLKDLLGGHEQCCISLLLLNRLNKTESGIFQIYNTAERSARGHEQCCINHCCYWIDSIKPSLVYSKYTILLKDLLGGREQCCINHCCYWIDSIKPSLVYSKYTIRLKDLLGGMSSVALTIAAIE